MSHPRRRPDERRFEEYDEFIDRTGFKIKEDGQFISFYYDKNKGWFDEYGNYYNSEGRAAKPNKESLDFWHKEIKHIYNDPLLEDYDLAGSQSSDSYFDDHDDADYDDPEVIEQIIQQQNQTTIQRNEQPQKSTPTPKFTNSNQTQKTVQQQQPKQQEPKQEQAVQHQPQQEEKKSSEPQAVKPVQNPPAQNQGPRVYVNGLKIQSVDEFIDWLLKAKKVKQTWTGFDSMFLKDELKVKLFFPSKAEAEAFVTSLDVTNGKVSYKAKYSLTFKVEA